MSVKLPAHRLSHRKNGNQVGIGQSNSVMNQVSTPGHPDFHARQSGQWRSVVLAALVHLFLLGFLWFGIRWQNKQPTAVEAEVWDMKTQEAAPLPVETTPPEPFIAKEQTPPPVAKEELPKEDPEIALQQEKKRKQQEKAKEELRLRELEQEKLQAEKELQAKKEKAKAQLEKEREKERLKEQELEKQKAKEDKEKQEKKKLADQKAQQAKEKIAADKVFKENMQRLASQAGSGGNGVAARSTGNNRGDPGYAAKIAAKIRSNTNFSAIDSTPGNPTVEYRIELLPGGSLRGPIRKIKSSGIPGFDEAVAKGIEKSVPFPADKSGEYPALDLIYKMKEE
jgi:colicin import membrane protein